MSLTVNVLYEHDREGNAHGCSHIRLFRPLSHPSVQRDVQLIPTSQLSPRSAEVVIVERWWKPDLSERDAIQLVAEIRRRRATLIYTLDDNLLDLGLDEEGDAVADDKLRATRYFARAADGVIVSTPALARRIAVLNPHVLVVPNALDEQLFLPPVRHVPQPASLADNADQNEKLIRIGYMGTLTHVHDLQMIVEPLRKLVFRHSERVRFEIVGVSSGHARIRKIFGHAVRFLEPVGGDHYESFVNWFRSNARWDIGLAPLSGRSFNRYKSDIKYLDYGVMGIPGIFSNIGPYPAAVRNGVTGIIVENEVQAWYEAMEALVRDGALRRRMGASAFEHVVTDRMLEIRAVDWLRAINEIRLHPRHLMKMRRLSDE